MLAASIDDINRDMIVEHTVVLYLRYVATILHSHQSSSVNGDKIGNDLDVPDNSP